MTFLLTNQISAYQILKVESSIQFVSILSISLALTHEKTEHNILKVLCTKHFVWLLKFPNMEITKVICTWPPMGQCQMFIQKYNEKHYFNQIE